MSTLDERALRMVEQAMHWSAVLRARPRPEDEEAFGAWLSASPDHLATLLKQVALDDLLSAHIPRSVSAPPVAPIAHPTSVAVLSRPHRRRAWAIAASIAALLVVAALGLLTWRSAQWRERAAAESALPIELEDGSRIELYAHSQVRFRDFLRRHEIELVGGGARFLVHPSPWQHFQVHSGATSVTATGTAFNVLRVGSSTGVYVSEGSVLVESARQRAHLHIDQAIRLSDAGRMSVLLASPGLSQVVRTAPLRAIAAEVNRRQRTPQLDIQGAAGEREVMSNLSFDDPELWARALESDPALIVKRHDQVVIVTARATP